MAETIIFNLPTSGPYEDPAYDMVWYQSIDGITWGVTPVDTILVSALPLSPGGQFIWASALADPNSYHKIKSRTQLGVESAAGIVLAPRVLSNNTITGISLTNKAIYSLGDKVELMLEVDADKLNLVGDQLAVEIVDIFGNSIASIVADRLGNLFIAEWTVPLGLRQLYNPTNQPESVESTTYSLIDRWMLNGTQLSFGFEVLRSIESATEENSIIQVILDGIKSAATSTLRKTALVFGTTIKPFYTTVREVKDTYVDLLGDTDSFTVARAIWNISNVVDQHMAPAYVDPARKTAFDLAVRNYVKYQSAITLLAPMMQMSSETKELDTFKISRSAGNPRQILDFLEQQARKYALIIWAGGLDTPFTSKRFEKGLWDPNRLNIPRAKLDTSDRFPWVNKTTANSLMMIDGDQVEVRGERTISLNANPRFDYSNMISLENPEGLWLI